MADACGCPPVWDFSRGARRVGTRHSADCKTVDRRLKMAVHATELVAFLRGKSEAAESSALRARSVAVSAKFREERAWLAEAADLILQQTERLASLGAKRE